MKVFISWSGEASKGAATALSKAIGDVFNTAEPWVSASDISPGQQWFPTLMGVLAETKFAIVCLTHRNATAPWLMFESGAVSGRFGDLKLVPLLLEGAVKDLVDPMARFNGTAFDRGGVLALFGSINESLGTPMTPKALRAAFDAVWSELEAAVQAAIKGERRTDVFLSVPMASFESDAQYQPFRADAMKVVKALRERCGLTVFCALEKIESIAQFDTYGAGAQQDIRELRQSANFVMLYPERLATSALFEAGYALALGMPCRFFVRDQHDERYQLPFLMRSLPEAFSHVSIIDDTEWTTYEHLADRLVQNKDSWFGKRHHAQFRE